jgi:transposase-like protein
MSYNKNESTSTTVYADEISPDSLMHDFRGRPIVLLLAATVMIHAVLLGVFSIGYLKTELFGENTAGMKKEERLDAAVKEARAALTKIAERHDLSPQELSRQFGERDGQPSAAGKSTNVPTGASDDSRPPSSIEKELRETKVGPEMPEIPEDEDDLFD